MNEKELNQQAERVMAENFTGLTLPLRNAYKKMLIKELKIRYAKGEWTPPPDIR